VVYLPALVMAYCTRAIACMLVPSAVERIIISHHGQVRVSSQQGVGAEITVSLSFDATPGQPEPSPEF
jgi:hypothetical protein